MKTLMTAHSQETAFLYRPYHPQLILLQVLLWLRKARAWSTYVNQNGGWWFESRAWRKLSCAIHERTYHPLSLRSNHCFRATWSKSILLLRPPRTTWLVNINLNLLRFTLSCQCSASCGKGTRDRTVRCFHALEYKDDIFCDSNTRPSDKQPCNKKRCLPNIYHWQTSVWTEVWCENNSTLVNQSIEWHLVF